MLLLLFSILITYIICSGVMLVSSLLMKKVISDREKGSPYECGFQPKESARLPFSLRFFLITIVFLIFDVEITLLLPIIPILTHSNIFSWLFTSILFLIILLLGLFYEWANSALDWSK